MYTNPVNIREKNKIKDNIKNLKRGFNRNISGWLIMLPSIVLFILFVWHPLISGLVLSFFKTKGFEIVNFVAFDNYVSVFKDAAFLKAFSNSFSYTFWSLLIGFLFPIIVAIMLNEMVHLKSFLKFSVYFPVMVPAIATSLLWVFIFYPGESGLLNSILSSMGLPASQWLQNTKLTIPLIVITMTWRGFGATTILYLASLQGINDELYNAAAIDGAGLLVKIKNITIPQISNVIKLMLVMQIINVFQVMSEPLTMTDGGPNNSSISLVLQSYFYGFRYFEAGKSMATSSITFLVLIVMTAIYFRINKDND